MHDHTLHETLYSPPAELCAQTVHVGGLTLTPDNYKAYCQFTIAHAFPAVFAFGTAFAPATLAQSWPSMLHQVFNDSHQMKSYAKDDIPRDWQLGTIVALELAGGPVGSSLTLDAARAPFLRAAAVIHKQAERVQRILGEHLSGRHKWTVSLECNYSLLQSGFLVGQRAQANPRQAALLQETTPPEVAALPDYGYVPVELAPEDLFATFDVKKRRMVSAWQGLPVVLLKGGLAGRVEFCGVGMVRYGAEREAEIQQVLATDPDALPELAAAGIVSYFEKISLSAKKLLTPDANCE